MAGPIRVVIADEHRLFREGLRSIFRHENGIRVVGEASNGAQAIDVISDLKPDVVLLEIIMPLADGLDVIPPLKEKSPKTKPLIFSEAMDESLILKALKVGACGYISKDASVPELSKAIQTVQKGELWVERKMTAKLIEEKSFDHSGEKIKHIKKTEGLTMREREVLRLLSKGCSNREIARALFISHKTVKSHLNNIFRKLNVKRRLHAILYAIRYEMA